MWNETQRLLRTTWYLITTFAVLAHLDSYVSHVLGKNCLHNSVPFLSLPTYVQNNLAVGQSWVEGDVAFHRKIVVPTLLVHGLKDKFVSLVEMCEMERVIVLIILIVG